MKHVFVVTKLHWSETDVIGICKDTDTALILVTANVDYPDLLTLDATEYPTLILEYGKRVWYCIEQWGVLDYQKATQTQQKQVNHNTT